MRVILTFVASSLLVTAAWATARWEEPTGSPYTDGTGGSAVGAAMYEPYGEEMRGATGSGHTHAASTGSGMTGTGATSTGGGL